MGATTFLAVVFATRLDFAESEVFFLEPAVAGLAGVFAAGLFEVVLGVPDLAAREDVLVTLGVFFAFAFFVGVLWEDFAAFASSSETSTYSLRISNALNALSIAVTTARAVGRLFAGALRVVADDFLGARSVDAATLLEDVFGLEILAACFFAGAFFGAVFEAFADVFFGCAFGFFEVAVFFFADETAFLAFLLTPPFAEVLDEVCLRLDFAIGFLAFGFAPVFAFFALTDFAGFLAVLLADGAFPFFAPVDGLDVRLSVGTFDLVPDSLEVFCVSAGNVI